MTNTECFVYGSGHVGCLYDFGPHYTEDRSEDSLQGVVDSFVQIFGDSISEEEEKLMEKNLRENGIHYFSNPAEAGAQYCDVSDYEMSDEEFQEYESSL